MTSGYQVVLDACVLVNAALRDTLLRIAEPPRLYLPRWSEDIMEETTRALENKLGQSQTQTSHLLEQLKIHFPDCWVEGYKQLIPAMNNHPKDRHVLAAAVRTGAQTIVTFNTKDFPAEALSPWNIEVQTPDEFLVHQYHLDETTVLAKLEEQSARRGGMKRLLEIHQKTMPKFVALIR